MDAKLGTINAAQKPSDETAVSPMAAGFNSEGGSKKNGKFEFAEIFRIFETFCS